MGLLLLRRTLIIFYFLCLLSSKYCLSLPIYSWSQIIDGNNISIRAIIEGSDSPCPNVIHDEKIFQMIKRKNTNADAFPVAVCEAVLPQSYGNISIDGEEIPNLKSSDLKTIAFIGDSGCKPNMSCKNKCDSRPFNKIIKAISLHNPDLVVHLGDYIYSHKKHDKACYPGALYGDNMQNWEEEFLKDFKHLMHRYPIIFARGNHEICSSAGAGWSLLFKGGHNTYCEYIEQPMKVQIGVSKFLILDNSIVGEKALREEECKNLSDISKSMIKSNADFLSYDQGNKNYIIMHKPLHYSSIQSYLIDLYSIGLNLKAVNSSAPKVFQNFFSDCLDEFIFSTPHNRVDAIFAGHIHDLWVYYYKEAKDSFLPVHVVSGGGGVEVVNSKEDIDLKAQSIVNSGLKYFFNSGSFGFAILKHIGQSAFLELYDENNEKIFEFDMKQKQEIYSK